MNATIKGGAKSPAYHLMNREDLRLHTVTVWARLTQYRLDHPAKLCDIAQASGLQRRALDDYDKNLCGFLVGYKLAAIDKFLTLRGY